MFDLIFLRDPNTTTQTVEVVVAVLLILLTGLSLFFLYRNVVYHITRNRLERQAMREKLDEAHESTTEKLINENNKPIFKDNLLGSINTQIVSASEGSLSLFFVINLDDFRYIVEKYDQKEIDKVVSEIVKRLKKYAGKENISGHLENDIFVFYYQGDVNNESINQVARELSDLINEPLKLDNSQITASIGIAIFPYDGITAEQLLKNAEIALYVAKKAGKNRFSLYSQDMIEKEQFNINYYKQIKRAIEKDEFLLYYQPIIDVRTGRIIGLESLLRWQHPTMGVLSPGKFLNVMDLTGDITWFGTWGFEKVASQYDQWMRSVKVRELFISINLSPKQLYVENLARQFYNITIKHNLSPEMFCLEIIDYYTITRNPIALTNLKEFRKFGFRVAVDDMGDNYSVIADMSKISASIFKLTRTNLLMVMDKDENAAKIEKVIMTAKQNQKVVIAEGIENETMIKAMASWDIRFMQGFYFSQPLAVAEVEKILKKSPWNMSSFSHLIR
jgi:diguanylate cyclase (GGDEF)-like protein